METYQSFVNFKLFSLSLYKSTCFGELRTYAIFEQHMSSPPIFSGVRVTRSLVLYVCFVDRCLSCCTLFWPLCCLFFFVIRFLIAPLVSFGHCVLFFFDIRFLIASLVSSNSSYKAFKVLLCLVLLR